MIMRGIRRLGDGGYSSSVPNMSNGDRRRQHGAVPESETSPRKKQKRETTSLEPTGNDGHASRKGKSCSSCRRLKVKCDLAEKATGACSRCTRLGIQCLSEKKTWTSAGSDDQSTETPPVIIKLERAVQDILQKLNLPPLEMYDRPDIVELSQTAAKYRPRSPDPTSTGGDISPGPISSLIEATRLESLRSRLRSVKQRRRGGMRRMDADLVSENLITGDEAEEMLEVFHSRLSHHLFSARVKPDATLADLRTSSTVLFTAIIMVAALHLPGKERLHKACHSRFLGLISSAIFDPFHTLDDIKGLCIAAFWQPDLTWKLSGIAIRMATELGLHHAFHEAFHTPDLADEVRKDCVEKARLWYFMYLLDHTSSIAYGRPPVMAELRPIKDCEVLLRSQWCTSGDRALLALVTGCAIMSRAFEMFGLEPKRTMNGDDGTVLNHLRFFEDLRNWKDRWVLPGESGIADRDNLARGVELHYHFSQLVLNALVLRGRHLDQLQDLPTTLRPLALRAIEAAHSILQHFISEPSYRNALVGMPLYLHSMIAFAVVFLMRLSHKWHVIGITISPAERTLPLIDGIIKLLRASKAGAAHMVFSMANGFERMLKQSSQKSVVGQPLFSTKQQESMHLHAVQHSGDGNTMIDPHSGDHSVHYPPQTMINETYGPDSRRVSENESPFTNVAFAMNGLPDLVANGWAFEDEELWNLGLGYDLLAPSGHGLSNPDSALNINSTGPLF